MTRNIKNIKSELIKEITAISSKEELEGIVKYLKLKRLNNIHGDLFKDMRKVISVEDLKKDQNYAEIDREIFDNLVEEMDIQEPIEELLSMLD